MEKLGDPVEAGYEQRTDGKPLPEVRWKALWKIRRDIDGEDMVSVELEGGWRDFGVERPSNEFLRRTCAS